MPLASDISTLTLAAIQFGAAVITLLLILRIAYILGANPIGELGQELVYLRMRELRQPGLILMAALMFEIVQFSFPLLEVRGLMRDGPLLVPYVDATQAIFVAVAAFLSLLVVRRYTHRALDRRIRESMETLAYLEGQRRRRRGGESRREWESNDDD